jgi:hypothetical protein
MKYQAYFTLIIIITTLCACNQIPENVKQTLELAGENRTELQKVIDHYQKPEDSLKLKAAYFLIGNMKNKFFYPYNTIQKKLMDSLVALGSNIESKRESLSFHGYTILRDTLNARANSYWGTLKERTSFEREQIIKDVNIVTSKLLIENIDCAFKVWENVPWSKHYTFDQFCEYVLPYRTSQDVPGFWRKSLVKRYGWLLDTIKQNEDFLRAAEIIDDSLYFQYNEKFEEFSNTNIMDMDVVKLGTCRQHSSFKMALFRALGIPISEVQGLHGTSWVIVPDETGRFIGWESNTSPKMDAPYIDDLRYENYSKVLRYAYKIQPIPIKDAVISDIPHLFLDTGKEDVTKNHNYAANISLKLSLKAPRKTNHAFLCVFSGKTKNWEASGWSKIEDGHTTFKDMGLNRIYLPMYYLDNNYYPAGNAFYVNNKGNIIDLKSDITKKEVAKIYSKTHLNYWEKCYADMMINDVFEGANDESFKNSTELYGIVTRAIHVEEKPSITNQKFRYVRYRAVRNVIPRDFNAFNTRIHLADIAFLDKEGQILKGRVMASSEEHLKSAKNAFDEDIRTNFNSRELCWIGLDLGKPTEIGKVKYLFRNSFNTVEANDEYELFYWDNQWKSLGRQIAKTHYLEYEIPSHSVLWLRNLTKGKSEMIFFMQNGKQIWGR